MNIVIVHGYQRSDPKTYTLNKLGYHIGTYPPSKK